MCNSDISTVPFEWDREKNMTSANARTAHMCRDFETIKDWAAEHRIEQLPDPHVYVAGNPIFKGLRYNSNPPVR